MSDRDAFEEEMNFLGWIGDGEAERLLTGRPPLRDRDHGEVAAFIATARATVPVEPSLEAEAFLVPRLAAEARAAGDAIATPDTAAIGAARSAGWRTRLAPAARVAVAVALVPVAMGGLAFAGVRLPEPAREAFDRVGIELPNQGGDDDATKSGAGGATGGDDRDAKSGSTEAGSEAAKRDRGSSAGDRPAGTPGGDGDESAGAQGGGGGGAPSGTGPAGVPPGQGGTPPGQGGTPPGQASPPPGQGGTPPGQGGTIPGSGSGGQSAEPHGGGPPGAIPPGQANPK